MKSLITGGAGFIGSHVVREVLKSGHEVIVLDDLSGGFEQNVPDHVTLVKGSITDHVLLEELFSKHQFDYVYHLAAYAAEGLSHFIRRFNYNNNLIGSINLINESIKNKVKCFVFTSSIAVYGNLQPPMKESMRPIPEDPYGVAKLAVEMDLKAAHEMFGLNYIIFRPHNVYGEFQNIGDKYRNVVGIFMNQLLQGIPLTIFGDGNQSRAFSYVGDIAPQIAQSVNFPSAYNMIFNIGSEQDSTVNDLAKMVMEVMGIDGKVNHLEARNEVKHAFSDHSLFESVFGKSTATPLLEGLTKMAAWVKKNGSRSSQDFGQIEILEKLPPSWKSK